MSTPKTKQQCGATGVWPALQSRNSHVVCHENPQYPSIFLLLQKPSDGQLVASWWSNGGRNALGWSHRPPIKSLFLCWLSGIGGRVVDFFDIACACMRTCARMCARNNKVFISLRSYRFPPTVTTKMRQLSQRKSANCHNENAPTATTKSYRCLHRIDHVTSSSALIGYFL